MPANIACVMIAPAVTSVRTTWPMISPGSENWSAFLSASAICFVPTVSAAIESPSLMSFVATTTFAVTIGWVVPLDWLLNTKTMPTNATAASSTPMSRIRRLLRFTGSSPPPGYPPPLLGSPL